MRVYEFAKEHNKTSKEILQLLNDAGFEEKSHMSILSDDAISFLVKKINFADHDDEKKEEKKIEGPSVKTEEPEKKRSDVSEKNPQIKKSSAMQHENNMPSQKAPIHSVPLTAEKKRGPLVLESMTLGGFCEKTNLLVNEVILSLLKAGRVCTKNNLLKEEEVQRLAQHYDIETISRGSIERETQKIARGSMVQENAEKRLPVVVVMGHVDHGKTTLLDFIRKTRVAAKEKGGITQHLGAYKAKTAQGDVIFLDTPGHEAFSKIRKRGASVADIAILVVAADDGIMPQTIESIKAARALDIPIIVAINKVDRVDEARLEVIKRQLTQHALVPEEWGGETICVPVSAKEGTGVDALLEMVCLQSEMMDLKAARDIPAQGYVLESKIQKGRGAVATVLCRQGTLKVGDYFSSGAVVGRVTSLTDSSGKNIQKTFPSIPVLVTGFDDLPDVGEAFNVVDVSEYKAMRSGKGSGTASSALQYLVAGDRDDKQRFNLILRADTNSSLEAILDAIAQFDKKETKQIVLVRVGIGDISESDVLLAEDVGATIVGFNVKADRNSLIVARQSKVNVELFYVIYKLIDELKAFAVRVKEVKKVRTKIGEGEVLKVFNIKKLGVIAGCVVREGRFSGEGIIKIKRGRKELGEGKIKSLQRDKKMVKEVHAGYDCAFLVEGFEDWQEGDQVECYFDVASA